ncbi:MAG: DUF881 domain-containing protein [Actinomycetes bacterium]
MPGLDLGWPASHRGRRVWALAVPLVFVLAGVLFATSAETAQGTDLRAGRRTELTDLIRAEEERVASSQRQLQDLRAEVDSLSGDVGSGSARGEQTLAAVQRLRRPAGLVPVEGPAISVTLDDAPRPTDGSELPGNPSPDDLVVHQQDVQAVVNALWAGGAEAMQLMDQRVVSTSAVRCVGNTLILHGVVYSPPFTVTAIGNVEQMQASLDAAPLVLLFRQYVDAYGLGYEVDTETEQRLPGYRGPLQMEHARVPQE